MKIRSIELTNVRRFSGRTARITGIGDGITVLSEPNEFGKSTFFDALHALFFERHRGTKQSVKALQPHAGGAPEIALEIDLPQGRFRIEKRWLSRATARVLDGTGRLIAQDDEAEAWIDRLLGNGLSGPSGLLWVRQGLLGIEPEGGSTNEKNERERGLNTRRDLLSSVAGEIDLMTGGRRLDAVLARIGQELVRLATSTLKPKTGGEWAKAADEMATLRMQEAELADKAARLSGDLARRADVMRQLSELDDPEAERQRSDRLVEAEQTQKAAVAYAEKLAEARQSLKLAQLTEAGTQTEIQRLEQLSERLVIAEADLHGATGKANEAESRAEELAKLDRSSASTLTSLQEQEKELRGRFDVAQRARLAEAARDRAQALQKALHRAEDLRRSRENDLALQRVIVVTPARLAQAEAAREVLDRISAQLEAQSVSVSVRYDGAARISVDGTELPDGGHLIDAARDFLLPGIGSMRVDPGSGTGEDLARRRTEAEAALKSKLLVCDASSLAGARQKLAETQRLGATIASTDALLAEIAPQGLDVLRQELARAQIDAGAVSGEAGDPVALEAALVDVQAAIAQAQARATEVHSRAVIARETRAAANSARQAAERAAETARLDAGAASDLAVRLQSLRADLVTQGARLSEAWTFCDGLEKEAPDLEMISAQLSRAQSVVTQTRTRRDSLRNEFATLNGSIGALAEQGIEELLDETRGRLAAATAREARYAAEVQALARLRGTLEDARKQARDAYFAPVLRELEPLLAEIHPGAEMQIDDQTLLPVALTRNGQQETLDILSGGTREQIAILTRLAFARLFAKAGQTVPVILDDALVHSDDDRIEAMFNALHRVAKDQQIIVLTCRQRAFSALGGDRAVAVLTDA
ncbi:AAA family ATPase [Paracoccus aestuariivivens]|uniref:AAA family ATPase n=1 Tax=Paracoccus aestuariivivens TaxID=1820333 RepID=A0A6L6JBA9_9RHOB|nr:AAA family ATPase [Paracoccus aestuariivivens]MTH77939.1 AAA family ATPase [Paracoccus aestuariivivens]